MKDLSLLADGANPMIEPPEWPKFDSTLHFSQKEHMDRNPEVYSKHFKEEEIWSMHRNTEKGISEFKLCSQGWIVTAEETLETITSYNAVNEESRITHEKDETWNVWINWLKKANQGFYVN